MAQSKNNRFEIAFYDKYKIELFSKSIVDTAYTLSEDEWSLILAENGDHFYCAIKTYHDDEYGCTTGPYISRYYEVSKPVGTIIDLNGKVDGSIPKSGKYTWYKFVAPTSGIYTFYTESSIDTNADMFQNPIYGLSITDRILYNDDAGEGLNFSLTYEMDYKEAVFIRVRGYGDTIGDYKMCVDFEEHVHRYNVTCIPNDVYTHRCACDCGLYEDVEHNWISFGLNGMTCMECIMTVVGTIPGGTISSVDNEIEPTTNCLPPNIFERKEN